LDPDQLPMQGANQEAAATAILELHEAPPKLLSVKARRVIRSRAKEKKKRQLTKEIPNERIR
jgi:hypothetical protein